MRKALGPIIALALIGLGCAASVQETRMFNGPFGRTEIGGFVIAADPAASKMLVQTYDGALWVYAVSPRVTGRLGALRVGDEVSLAFDDRVAGPLVLAIDVMPPGRHPLPGEVTTAAGLLPFGVVVGAPAIAPSRGVVMAGTGVVSPVVVTEPGVVTDIGAPRVFVPSGGSLVASGGVIVPGFASFSTIAVGPLGPQTTQSLGLVPSVAFAPVTTPGASVAGAFPPGGQPVPTGPFTPGTSAPGVSPAQGNAPPTRPTPGGGPVFQMQRSVPLNLATQPTPGPQGQGTPTGQGAPTGQATPSQTTTTGQPTLPGQTAPNQGQAAPPQGQAAPAQGQPAPAQGQAAPAQGQPAPNQGTAAPAAGKGGQPAGAPAGGARGGAAPGSGGTTGSNRD